MSAGWDEFGEDLYEEEIGLDKDDAAGCIIHVETRRDAAGSLAPRWQFIWEQELPEEIRRLLEQGWTVYEDTVFESDGRPVTRMRAVKPQGKSLSEWYQKFVDEDWQSVREETFFDDHEGCWITVGSACKSPYPEYGIYRSGVKSCASWRIPDGAGCEGDCYPISIPFSAAACKDAAPPALPALSNSDWAMPASGW